MRFFTHTSPLVPRPFHLTLLSVQFSPRLHPVGEKRPHRVDRVHFIGAFVGTVSFYPRKPQRYSPGILRATLNLVERDLDYQLWPYVDDVTVASHFPREQLLRLPLEHLVGHSP